MGKNKPTAHQRHLVVKSQTKKHDQHCSSISSSVDVTFATKGGWNLACVRLPSSGPPTSAQRASSAGCEPCASHFQFGLSSKQPPAGRDNSVIHSARAYLIGDCVHIEHDSLHPPWQHFGTEECSAVQLTHHCSTKKKNDCDFKSLVVLSQGSNPELLHLVQQWGSILKIFGVVSVRGRTIDSRAPRRLSPSTGTSFSKASHSRRHKLNFSHMWFHNPSESWSITKQPAADISNHSTTNTIPNPSVVTNNSCLSPTPPRHQVWHHPQATLAKGLASCQWNGSRQVHLGFEVSVSHKRAVWSWSLMARRKNGHSLTTLPAPGWPAPPPRPMNFTGKASTHGRNSSAKPKLFYCGHHVHGSRCLRAFCSGPPCSWFSSDSHHSVEVPSRCWLCLRAGSVCSSLSNVSTLVCRLSLCWCVSRCPCSCALGSGVLLLSLYLFVSIGFIRPPLCSLDQHHVCCWQLVAWLPFLYHHWNSSLCVCLLRWSLPWSFATAVSSAFVIRTSGIVFSHSLMLRCTKFPITLALAAQLEPLKWRFVLFCLLQFLFPLIWSTPHAFTSRLVCRFSEVSAWASIGPGGAYPGQDLKNTQLPPVISCLVPFHFDSVCCVRVHSCVSVVVASTIFFLTLPDILAHRPTDREGKVAKSACWELIRAQEASRWMWYHTGLGDRGTQDLRMQLKGTTPLRQRACLRRCQGRTGQVSAEKVPGVSLLVHPQNEPGCPPSPPLSKRQAGGNLAVAAKQHASPHLCQGVAWGTWSPDGMFCKFCLASVEKLT